MAQTGPKPTKQVYKADPFIVELTRILATNHYSAEYKISLIEEAIKTNK